MEHDLFDRIDNLVKRHRWTHDETYDAALAFFSKLRSVGLSNMKGQDWENFKETRWTAK
ncbi:hypothetical protein BDV23DRAFT_165548 [Aspergillus alliaceus]|uniref:Uncharacterized protein n=1 Tax=Petromyces alliaceus TaxID=209559 RepID=A0A5N7BTW6_PETAA|nr:hypothetical protein BDV23DRAFT_165548 [Aspergillus alliaceus]